MSGKAEEFEASTHSARRTNDPALANRSTKAKAGSGYFGKIRVVVRCRPLHPVTEVDHTTSRLSVDGDDVVVADAADGSVAASNEARSFHFDRVLGPQADQAAAFTEVAPLIDHVLDGYHATVFAYGQTGSGKTFTMDGLNYQPSHHHRSNKRGGEASLVPDTNTPSSQHGIMPRMIQLLFDKAHERVRKEPEDGSEREATENEGSDDGVEFSFRCSFLQIYNEKISDLLRPTSTQGKRQQQKSRAPQPSSAADGLRLRWQRGDVFRVENLFVQSCSNAEQMRQALFSGIEEKVVGSHLMNLQSSRSHCIFTVYVEQRSRKSGELLHRSELSLVDLAGSEKLSQMSHRPSSQLMRESIDINTSLLALGKVIMALSEGPSPRGGRGKAASSKRHIPYRESKLTMLLKHALGGNSLTTMIACISPSDRYIEESLSTLLYAGRAKNICNVPHVNEDPTAALIRQLREEIQQLKRELEYYRSMAANNLSERGGSLPQIGGLTAQEGRDQNAAPGVPGSPTMDQHVDPTSATQITTLRGQTNTLADSLLSACEMLKKLMNINAELRSSYDALREEQEETQRRERDLNAENLALRERLSVIESIAIQEAEEAGDGEEEEEEENEEGGPQRAEEDSAISAEEDEVMNSSSSSSTTVSGAGSDSITHRQVSPPPPVAVRALLPRAQVYPPLEDDTPVLSRHVVVDMPPLQSFHVARGTTREVLPGVVDSREGAPVHPFHSKKAAGAPPRNQQARRTRSSAAMGSYDHSVYGRASRSTSRRGSQASRNGRSRRPTTLEQKLKDYERQYRNPQREGNYDSYYNTNPHARMTPQPRSFRPDAQASAALAEMSALAQKLPSREVPELIPSSLINAGQFGRLAFGGLREDAQDFEALRRNREARLQAMRQQQQALYSNVHEVLKAASHGVRRRGGEDGGGIDGMQGSTGSVHRVYAETNSPYSYSASYRSQPSSDRALGQGSAKPGNPPSESMQKLLRYLSATQDQ